MENIHTETEKTDTTQFVALQLNENLLKGIVETGFSHCMPVQEETFLHTFKGSDVHVKSQTGTGKTAAFLISIFQQMLHNSELSKKKALIIAPTRELVLQIESEAKQLGKYLDFTIGCMYGGVGYVQQEKLLAKNVQIIVGTPGRLLDFYHQGKLHFKDVGILVIDEADRMFDMGFLPDVRKMIKQMPPPGQRITMLFSATLDYRVKELAWEYMKDPAEIEIKAEQVTVENIVQELYHVAREDKMSLLLGVLKREQPECALIFTNTRHEAVRIAKRLEYNGYPCDYIMGDMPQSARLKIIKEIKSGKIRLLAATDVAARGLHIEGLELVINYDIPLECDNYVHRIGRTARVGKSGKAISLACDRYVLGLEAIEEFINMKIPVIWAPDELYCRDKSTGKTFAGYEKTSKTSHPDSSSRKKAPAARPSPKKSTPVKRPAQAKTADRRRAKKKKPPRKSSSEKRSPAKPLNREERLNYYRKKYGENFGASKDVSPAKQPAASKKIPEKKSIFKTISRFFTGNS